MSKQRRYHVIPSPDGGWSIRREGAERASNVFDRKSEAIEAGRGLARNSGSELIVHGKDGRIRDSASYGNDPHPPKSKPRGFDTLSGRFDVKSGVDVTKPIYQQAERKSRRSLVDRRSK